MELELETFRSLPCSTKQFRINGVIANTDDFGEVIKENAYDEDCDVCYLSGFKYKLPTDAVLKKYGITLSEYQKVCEELHLKFNYGICNWCI